MQGAVTTPQSWKGTALPAARVLHSDPHDFAGLYLRHRSSLAHHARGYLNDSRDVDEVVQDAFLRLFLALPELDTELQALAYCRRTITNLCIDRYRATQRRPRLVGLDSITEYQLADDEPSDPVVQAEDAVIVRTALSQLSALHREALVKREIEEKTVPVIAVELDIPAESVKHVLFRARRALRRLLVDTSVAPGAGAEQCGSLLRQTVRQTARDGGRVAALVAAVALALGLSAGPDLRMVPVVGNALAELPSLAEVAAPVGNVLERIGERVTRGSRSQSAPVRVATTPSPQQPASAPPEPASAGSRTSLETLLGRPFVPVDSLAGGPRLELLGPVVDTVPAALASAAPGDDAAALAEEAGSDPDASGAETEPGVDASPSPQPSLEPSPSTEPTPEASSSPTSSPTASPTSSPTAGPTPQPTPASTAKPPVA